MGDLLVVRIRRIMDHDRNRPFVLELRVGRIPRSIHPQRHRQGIDQERLIDKTPPTTGGVFSVTFSLTFAYNTLNGVISAAKREEAVGTKNLFLIGKAGVGKGEVSDILDRSGYTTHALADGVKYEYWRWYDERPTKADRAKVIEIAETYKRLYGPDVWCWYVLDGITNSWGEVKRGPHAITDGRFIVEYEEFVVKRKFVPVRITAPDELRFQRLIERDGVDQRSVLAGQETELDGVDIAWTIVNDTNDLSDLERKVIDMLEHVRKEA